MIVRFSEREKLKRLFGRRPFVFTAGCFDLLHVGHLALLEKIKSLRYPVVVGILPDSYIQNKKRRIAITKQAARARIVHALKPVDHVLLMPAVKDLRFPPLEVLKILRPNIFVTRYDKWIPLKKSLADAGVKVLILKMKKEASTSRMLKRALR